MSHTMKLLLATRKHISEIAKILHEEWYPTLKEAKKKVSRKIKDKECIIAVDSDVVGVLMFSRDYSHYANYCEDLMVPKEHRRKGIAMRLLKQFTKMSLKEQPKKQRLVLSSTDVSNTASIKLHLKMGFKKIGKLKGLHFGKDEVFFGYRV